MPGFRSWDEIRAEVPLNEERVAAYGRVMEVEERFYALLERRGYSGDALEAAFGAMQATGTAAERDDDTYGSIVAAYVTALGGRIEVQAGTVAAVFADATVTLHPGCVRPV